jgi:quercetin dioxygenase-like cupin family protein
MAGARPGHLVRRAGELRPAAPQDWAEASKGYARAPIVDETTPAVHTGFGICSLQPAGSVPPHLHAYEECFHILDGSVVLETPEGARLLRAGDYGLLPVGYPHAWRNDADAPARWADMLAPQPRSRFGGDTELVPAFGPPPPGAAPPIDVRDPRNRLFGHIDPANMDAGKQTQEMLAVSASMRTALLVYSGITVKMMVDTELGAQLATMFMVQYEPDGVAGLHDHPFEETYMFLEGEAEATFDGERYLLTQGDIAWAGVGCVHGFCNAGAGPVRWLETQAPQPPARYSYRFARDWDYLRAAVHDQQ